MRQGLIWAVAMGLLVAGCGDDGKSETDAGMDAGPVDAGDDAGGDAGGGPVTIEGLDGEVEVIQDERGYWHVYATTDTDAVMVAGWLMARDRLPQMELFRRSTQGQLAELFGALDPSIVEDDKDARFEQHTRNAQRIWDNLGAEEQAFLQAYADGVNVYIQAIRDGEATLPTGTVEVFNVAGGGDASTVFRDWTPIDTLAIVRYMTASLSFDPGDDIGTTEALAAWQDTFGASASDPRYSRLEDAFHDFYPFRPARDSYILDGFPNLATDTGSRALDPRGDLPRAAFDPPSKPVLEGASRWAERMERRLDRWLGAADIRGSNSWLVHGDQTESGNPFMCNDPHLSLSSPPLFWGMHLNTKKLGGEGGINVQGLAIVGTPAPILAYTDDIAWGLTTHGYDVTDAYREVITPVADGPDTVEFQGEQVPIETVTETIALSDGTETTVEYERVPHHGFIIPDSRTETEAISIKWTGNEPTNELGAFLDLMRASNVEEARQAWQRFEVGGQTLVVADTSGDIFYTSSVDLPVRDSRAMTYDPTTFTGDAPAFVLDGTGPHEWVDQLSNRYLPHVLNPEAGYVATANNDAVGSTDDDNPFNDPHYIGFTFASGFRHGRIVERLAEVTSDGSATVQDMQAIQADAQSPYGRFTTAALVAELDRAEQEMDSSGTHPDLTDAVSDIGSEQMTKILAARDRLSDWMASGFDTPAAVEGDPSADEIADSVAATIFNATYGRLQRLAFDDERGALGHGGRHMERLLQWSLNTPDSLASFAASFDPDGDGTGDTVLWDDITTDAVESRGERVLRAFASAIELLEGEFGADMNEWRWGKLHTITLDSQIPQLGVDRISIPSDLNDEFPNGFPRHGDRDVVDASGFSTRAVDADQFDYGSGPQQRLVVEMTPEGPVAYNAMPGGNALDPESPHHADEMELWRKNEAPQMWFDDADVEAHAETTMTFVP